MFSFFTFLCAYIYIYTHANRYLCRDTSHVVLGFLSFQIYLVRKSISTQKASIDSNDLKMESPGLCSSYQKCLQSFVRGITTTLIFAWSALESAGSFLLVLRSLIMKLILFLMEKERSDHVSMDIVHQYLKLFNSSFICTDTQIWLHITLLRALIILGTNENVHILNTLFADEIFWTLNSSGTDGEHMPSQFVWRAQPRVLPGLGN